VSRGTLLQEPGVVERHGLVPRDPGLNGDGRLGRLLAIRRRELAVLAGAVREQEPGQQLRLLDADLLQEIEFGLVHRGVTNDGTVTGGPQHEGRHHGEQ